MIILSFLFLYVLFLSYVYGLGTLLLIKKLTQIIPDQFPLIVFVGLASITTLGGVFSIFYRINWEFQLLLLTGGILLLIFLQPYKNFIGAIKKPHKKSHWIFLSFFVILCMILIHATSLIPANPDTSIYHAQTIHWIEDYPAVPGLANLHARLGYNSSWLLLNAIFSFPYLGLGSFHFMTGFLLTIAACYFLSGVSQLFQGQLSLSGILKIGFLVALFVFLLDQASSPGTDAPSTIFEWILITQTVWLFENYKKIPAGEYWIIALLAVYCSTIKISAFPILLLAIPALGLLFTKGQKKSTWILISLLAAILLPLLIRNVILTGYLVFPGPAIDLFHFDWRVPENIVVEESKAIHWFAAIPHMDQAEFYSLPASKWIPIWFANQVPRHKAILSAVLGLPVILAVLLVLKGWRNYLVSKKSILFPLVVSYLGIVFWFLAAPAFRFGYGFLLAAVLIQVSMIVEFLLKMVNWTQTMLKIAIYPGMIAIMVLSTISLPNLSSPFRRILLPLNYPDWSTEPCSFGNFTILCQVNYDACWYDAFPCAIKGEKNIVMRETDFSEGFRNLDNN